MLFRAILSRLALPDLPGQRRGYRLLLVAPLLDGTLALEPSVDGLDEHEAEDADERANAVLPVLEIRSTS